MRMLLLAMAALWLRLFIAIPAVTIAGDFFPIYHAAGLLLHGRSSYSLEAVRELQQLWPTPHAATDYSYPLPLAMLLVPIGVLPLLAAVIIWLVASTPSAFAVVRLRPDWLDAALLALLFMPFFDALRARQVSLLFFGLIVLLLLGMRAHRSWLVGTMIALLPIKPQIGLLFALYSLIWAWREDRRALVWALGLGVLVWGGSLALQPTWPYDWIAGLSRYTAVNQSITLLPWSLVLLLVTWHMPWPARIAAAQVALFPLVGVYTLLPLLLGLDDNWRAARTDWRGDLVGVFAIHYKQFGGHRVPGDDRPSDCGRLPRLSQRAGTTCRTGKRRIIALAASGNFGSVCRQEATLEYGSASSP